MAGFWKKKSGIFVFFWVWGLSGLRILLSYFWPAPLQRPKGKKKSAKYIFSDRQWVQTPAKPLFIEIEIRKNRFLIEKKNRPQISPKSALAYLGPWAAQGSGGAH